MNNKEVLSIFLRYSILLIAIVGNFYILSFLTPLTIHSVYFILNLFQETVLVSKDTILVNEQLFQIISACVALPAYYLLLVLNLSTRNIKISTRMKSILFSFIALFILNIIRILILIFISPEYFAITHKIFFYLLSTIFVLLIWILEVKIFKIKSIPFYSDIIYLKKNSLFNR